MIYVVSIGRRGYTVEFTPEQMAVVNAMLEAADSRTNDVLVTPLGYTRPVFTWRFLGRTP